MAVIFLKRELRKCRHANAGVYGYVRRDALLEDAFVTDDYQTRQRIKPHLSGLRVCLDCGSTQRYSLADPLGILPSTEKEKWLAPWIWRK